MSGSGVGTHRAQGDVVIERLNDMKPPKELKAPIAAFAADHKKFSAAGNVVTAAETKRDAALVGVATADARGLDPSLDVLANDMVGASMGKRQNPFKGYSQHAPAAMQSLAYAAEVKAVLDLTKKVRAAKPPASVTKSLNRCDQWAATVTTKLKALTLAQTRYDVALAARDKLLPGWSRSLARLKKKAGGAWADEMETYRGVFAPPDAVRAPVKKQAKKKKKPAPGGPPKTG